MRKGLPSVTLSRNWTRCAASSAREPKAVATDPSDRVVNWPSIVSSTVGADRAGVAVLFSLSTAIQSLVMFHGALPGTVKASKPIEKPVHTALTTSQSWVSSLTSMVWLLVSSVTVLPVKVWLYGPAPL